jgi:hypothetical protein
VAGYTKITDQRRREASNKCNNEGCENLVFGKALRKWGHGDGMRWNFPHTNHPL